MYFPQVKSGRLVEQYQLGDYVGMVITDCSSESLVHYEHILFMFRSGEENPCYAVAAEMSEAAATVTDGLFLGVFPGAGHVNLGVSADWRDLEKFTAKALELAVSHIEAL